VLSLECYRFFGYDVCGYFTGGCTIFVVGEWKMMYKRTGRGFTLIELLVVIAIIAILAAILFPVFTKARKTALKNTCLSNFKQVGAAMLLYVDDNDGRYPAQDQDLLPPGILASNFSPVQSSGLSTKHTAAGVIWTLRSYCKSTKFWNCPLGARWKSGNSNYTYPNGIAVNSLTWGMVGRIKGPGIGEVYTNYCAFALTRKHPPMRHDLAGGLAGDLMCAMGKTPVEFCYDCKVQGYQPWMFHDSYYVISNDNVWVPHGGIGGVYYDGSVKFHKETRAKDL
jgi:prepilin-type N-terminal cleavage/methylation domain-containing protein